LALYKKIKKKIFKKKKKKKKEKKKGGLAGLVGVVRPPPMAKSYIKNFEGLPIGGPKPIIIIFIFILFYIASRVNLSD
jgi:hypothetical protein